MNITNEAMLNMPGILTWKDKNSTFLGGNHRAAKMVGYKHGLDLEGCSYNNFSSGLSEDAERLISLDQEALNGKIIKTLNVHRYADGEYHTLLSEIGGFYQNGAIVGTIAKSIEITTGILCDLAKYLCLHDQYFKPTTQSSGSYRICEEAIIHNLSQRESQCLFYVIRGKSCKEISLLLNLSQKSIETYVERIKAKFNCHSKGQLIEYAITHGLIYLIPNTVLV